jgi:hypothetical protein
MSAAAMDSSTTMKATTRASDRSVIEVIVMTTEVVVIFPAVMDVEARGIDAATVSIWGISVNRIVGVTIAAPTAAAVTAVDASAERADAQADEDENWNCTSEHQVAPVPKELPK